MIALLLSVLAAGFLGSVHCAAMCGGLVAAVSRDPLARARARDEARSSNESRAPHGADPAWLAPAAWNVGRVFGYVALGLLAGSLGAGLQRAGAWAGVHRGAALVSGAMLIAWGAWGIVRARGGVVGAPGALAAHRMVGRALRALGDWPAPVRAASLGLATALLPCGFLWAFVATAAASGSALGGALVMLAFWASTLPALAGLAVIARRATGKLERRLPLVTAMLLVAIGLLTVAGKLGPRVEAASHPHLGNSAATYDCH